MGEDARAEYSSKRGLVAKDISRKNIGRVFGSITLSYKVKAIWFRWLNQMEIGKESGK